MAEHSQTDVRAVLGLDGKRPGGLVGRHPVVATLLVLLVIVAGGYWLVGSGDGSDLAYVTRPASRGELIVTVSATGTIQPINEVEVGTEVSGTVDIVAVEANDRVEAGDLLARLDTAKLEAQVLRSRAALAAAEAAVAEAEATVVEAQRTLDRTQTLVERSVTSVETLEAAEAGYDRAVAAVASARAQVDVAAADLNVDETNLGKAEIRAPIGGVVLVRDIEPGQTVAASMTTPVLFTLAEDLTAMELHVDVDEADVGQVADGQPASFTVDAYPDRQFPAEIIRINFAPDETDGVVTYEALLSVDNASMALRPGMTATAEIIVDRLTDALLVPNEGLRFSPPLVEENADSGGLASRLLPRMPAGGNGAASETGAERTLWVLRGGLAVEVAVTVGSSDGEMTVVLDGDLAEGDAVIVDSGNGDG